MKLSKEQIKEICGLGSGNRCCRYLSLAMDGWCCRKDQPSFKNYIDKQVKEGHMIAQGDGCETIDDLKFN